MWHFWEAILTYYGLTAVGILGGLRLIDAHTGRTLWALKVAVPVMLVVALAWDAIYGAGSGFFRTHPVITEVLQLAFIPVAAAVPGMFLVLRQPGVTHKRGTLILNAFRRKRARRAGQLTLAGEPVPEADETKHFKIIGTTGTGKSTAIRELLTGALARGDRAVIADPHGDYARFFYKPERGDVILNPFDERAARWDLFAEIVQLHDADQIARALIPDYEGPDRNWRGYARTFLTAVLRQMHRREERDPKDDLTELYRLLVDAPVEELKDLLRATPAAPLLAKGSSKFFDNVRAIALVHTAAIEHLARQTTGEMLSVRRWIREGKGVLFLPYRANEIEALRSVISTWMRIAIFETMNAKEEKDQKLWFVVDELEALGAIDGLKDALARLRKFGGRCILGFQSIGQVRGSYGETEAQTIVENCGTTVILRCSASEGGGTAEFASRLIGKREVIRRQTSRSRPDSLFSSASGMHTTSEQHAIEDAVMASEIEQLADLTGFLKLASQPQWRKVVLQPTER